MRLDAQANTIEMSDLDASVERKLELLAALGFDTAAVQASPLVGPAATFRGVPSVPASGPLAPMVPKGIPNPIGKGPMTNLPDVTGDPEGTINIPNENVAPQSPPTPSAIPDFSGLNDVRKNALLITMWVDLQRCENIFEPRVEGYRELFLYPLHTRADAIRAVACYDPAIIKELQLTYNQANQLMMDITARCRVLGVPTPPSWSEPLEQYKDTEDGDDED